MLLMPAVDIFKGRCVRFVRGNPAESKIYFDDPIEAAKMWEEQGAKVVHVVDLDAVLGVGDNLPIIRQLLRKLSIETQVGGGIRTLEKAIQLCDLGATRIMLGTLIIKRPDVLKELLKHIDSSRIIAALDYSGCQVATHGWKRITSLNVFSTANNLAKLGAGWILFSSIERDGLMTGPDLINIQKMVETVDVPVIAAGGVRSLNDIKMVKKTGVRGLVIGKALYEGAFTLREAQEALSKC